ncbi:IS66 family transposase [Asticcacaulis sp. W401b]|uniref:IS66 family transposase n=1 Tax=Asticcacaulis sp. W401b TaxID=3388666 RepID=UPI0039708082
MIRPPLRPLSDKEKDALIAEQADLLRQQGAMIEELVRRLNDLERRGGKARKTSKNSHQPPSSDGPGKPNRPGGGAKKPRPSRPGVSRRLADNPDRTERVYASECRHCHADVSRLSQHIRCRYDHIDLPPIRPVVTRVELMGGRCGCGRRFRAAAPASMPTGSPFGPGIRSLVTYLHHSHHVSFERLSRVMGELFGLKISEGGLTNIFKGLEGKMATACEAIAAQLRTARVVASDETTTRVSGITQWQWSFTSDKAVLHKIAPSRAKSVPQEVMAGHYPDVWISDRYAGQQELAKNHQVCLAHVLRDVQYAIDCGDTVFAPKIRDHLRWCIRVGHRSGDLKDGTLRAYAAKADDKLDKILAIPTAHPAGAYLKKQIKAWRTKFFVFMTDPRVPPTNNVSEREIRPSVVFRKVTNGFRSQWGADIHAGYRSITGTARLRGLMPYAAIRVLVDGNFAVA